MFEPDDVARSVRRYLGLLLPTGPPPDWTLRLERRNVSDDARPVGVVLLGEATTIEARETLEQGTVVDQYPVTVYLYPEVAEDAQVARREGDALRSLLHRLMKLGPALKDGPPELLDENERPKAGPYRLPLWDWDGIPSVGEAKDREPPEHAHDAMIVVSDSLNVQNLDDEEDERRRTVVCEFRLWVESPGRTDDRAGGVVTGISGTFGGEP
jgi:hypothetical protein